jgi:hypothetical protein
MATVRKPASPPTPAEVADSARWDEITSSSLVTTQAAAEKWRTGLAAFATLVTGGLLLKGPESAREVTTGWRTVLTMLVGIGLVSVIIGLWLALRAAAGSPSRVSYAQVRAAYGGVRQMEIAAAGRASEMLRWAKVAVGVALVLLGAAAITSWWAPSKPADPAAFVRVATAGTTVCGELKSGDQHRVEVQVAGESSSRSVALSDVTNLFVVASC